MVRAWTGFLHSNLSGGIAIPNLWMKEVRTRQGQDPAQYPCYNLSPDLLKPRGLFPLCSSALGVNACHLGGLTPVCPSYKSKHVRELCTLCSGVLLRGVFSKQHTVFSFTEIMTTGPDCPGLSPSFCQSHPQNQTSPTHMWEQLHGCRRRN